MEASRAMHSHQGDHSTSRRPVDLLEEADVLGEAVLDYTWLGFGEPQSRITGQ